MGEYYKLAYLVLSALDSADARDGFLYSRQISTLQPHQPIENFETELSYQHANKFSKTLL